MYEIRPVNSFEGPYRGSVYLVKSTEGSSERPWIVISNNVRNEFTETVTAVMVTTIQKGLIHRVEMSSADPIPGFANCDYAKTIHRDEISQDAGALSRATMRKVEQAFKWAHGLS